MPIALDDTTQRWLTSQAPQPTQDLLDKTFATVRRVQVVPTGVDLGEPLGTEVVADTDDPTDVAKLKDALRVVDGGTGHCMCHGDVALVLLDETGASVAVLGLHHGKAIRWNAWRDDAELVDGEPICRWLADHGVHSSLDEYQRARQAAATRTAEIQRWRSAVPTCLSSFIEIMMAHERGAFDTSPLNSLLLDTFPDARGRALALFEWLGHGAQPWNGSYAYERVPLALLGMMPLPPLLEALRAERLSDAQLEGAARFFSGWYFQGRGHTDVSSLIESDKKRLFEHVKRTGDTEACARLQKL